MTKHTPGPWQIGENYWEGDRLLIFGGENGGLLIAEVFEDEVGGGDADARLIAAAPELLAALKAIREAHIAGRGLLAAQVQVEAAIAEAEGD